ncbi:MAG TPA: adenylate/guanylate cyclase domain-containing protein, partial [Candidatus Binataceae bacterium]|nr:adenylate/guanylate cyclase domain-containing protein [Candidatus Binataceae bacterium]
MTVMFCDLLGSTELSTRVDPEEVRQVVRTYHSYCANQVRRFDGFVAQFLGDGIVVCFGYPSAHEDDAERAVRAGLSILEQLPNLNAQLVHPIQIRIGIHTGIVVVGANELFGATPNIASRIQAMARPDGIAISHNTYRLVEGLFACDPSEELWFKGLSHPLRIYHVLRESDASSRFEVVRKSGLTPLVGRDQEIDLLLERWELARAGHGQVILLSGEPGIGKSRLAEVVQEAARSHAAKTYTIRCSRYHRNTAFYPFIQFLRRMLYAGGDRQASLGEVEDWVKSHGFEGADVVPLLADLLSISLSDKYPQGSITPQKQRERLQQLMIDILVKVTAHGAILLVCEDLHWADASTVESLALLIDKTPSRRTMFLLTTRPELRVEWAMDRLTVMRLDGLEESHVVSMVNRVAAGKRLPIEVLNEIVSKTDGVPLFIEELTKAVIQSGLLVESSEGYKLTGPLPPLAIPTSLHDSLIARLDRLAGAKEVAQIAAVIGREFWYSLIQEVARMEDRALQQALARLVKDDLLLRLGDGEDARYVFRHALIQDAGYESLLKENRQLYHQRIAEALERRLSTSQDVHPELLAHHYSQAGLTARALPYWLEAGQRSLARSANIEAANHLMRGLELLAMLPESPERLETELTFQTRLGMASMATKGYAAPETRAAYERARELCSRVDKSPQLVPIMMGLSIYFMVRAEYRTTCDIAEQMLKLADTLSDGGSAMEAHIRYGYGLFYMGEFEQARDHLERAIDLYDPNAHRSHALLFGQEPAMASLSCEACVLWITGYPEKAEALCERSVRRARESSHAMTLAFASIYASMLHQWLGHDEEAAGFAADALSISSEQGLTFWSAVATLCRSAAESRSRPSQDAIAGNEDALRNWEATGARAPISYFRFHFAAALARAGHTSRAMMLVNEAIAELGDERFFEAELYRLKGELIQQSAGAVAGESCQAAEDCFIR